MNRKKCVNFFNLLVCSIYFSDRMAEIIKKEVDVKEFEITSIVEETCFVDIPEDERKLENADIKGNLNNCTFFLSEWCFLEEKWAGGWGVFLVSMFTITNF